MKKKIKHFLNLDEINTKQIEKILHVSRELKDSFKKRKLSKKKILAMIFEKPSTRTRVSFEVGMKQLNGDVVILDSADTQLGRGESLQDTIKVLCRYVDVIMYRGSDEKKMYEMTQFSDVPIINGLTNQSHPCQIIADIMTLQENFKSLKNLNLCWVGDGNNVCNSWIHSSMHFDFNLNICCPSGCFPKKELLKKIKNIGKIKIFNSPTDAVKGVDVIITDTWLSMGMKKDSKRIKKFKNFQVNKELVSKTNRKTYFLHCLPAHRGEEVTDEIIDGEHSLVWDEAENRLFAHQSILLWCLEEF